MIRYLAVFSLGVVVGCPSPPVVPPGPDATDATPPAPAPEGAPAPSTPCQTACNVLAGLGCPEGKPADCVTVFSHVDSSREKRKPCAATTCPPLTCMDVALATSVAAVRALGISCAQ